MKASVLRVLVLVFAPTQLFAFWLPRPMDHLIWDAQAIVIGEFDGYEATKNGAFHLQSARFRVVQTFKGKIPSAFRVNGDDSGICFPVIDFTHVKKGQYLMFLVPVEGNWFALDATMLPVVHGVVAWKEPLEKEGQALRIKDVERNIQRTLKKRPNKAPEPTPGAVTPRATSSVPK